MKIYQGIMTLDYSPEKEMLVADMPDIRVLRPEELRFCFGLVVDVISSRQVRRLLLDTSKSVVDLENAIYKNVITDFLAALSETPLTKMARIRTAGTGGNLFEGSDSIGQGQQQRITFRIFSSQSAASGWLLEQE